MHAWRSGWEVDSRVSCAIQDGGEVVRGSEGSAALSEAGVVLLGVTAL